MDTATVLRGFGIDSATVPPGAVKLFGPDELAALGGRCCSWSRKMGNDRALAYAVETEHRTPVGVALRNLHFGELKDHLLVAREEGPYWCGLHRSLPAMYGSGVAVLVEGPKDALVLHTRGIAAAAFLGVTPTRDHLRIIHRYVKVVVWIRDSDPPDVHGERRADQVRKNAAIWGLPLIEMRIPTKDPAELVKQPAYFDVIKDRVRELSRLAR